MVLPVSGCCPGSACHWVVLGCCSGCYSGYILFIFPFANIILRALTLSQNLMWIETVGLSYKLQDMGDLTSIIILE